MQTCTAPRILPLELLNIPQCSVNLHSPVHLPPLCLHSPGTNTKPSQGHLQDCFGQQFLPQFADHLPSDRLSDIHTYTELMTAFQPPDCITRREISLPPGQSAGSASSQKAERKTRSDLGELEIISVNSSWKGWATFCITEYTKIQLTSKDEGFSIFINRS